MADQSQPVDLRPTTANGIPIVGSQGTKTMNVGGFNLVLAATGVAQNAPSYPVPDGAVVRVKASNGLAAGNVNPVQVATYKKAAEVGPYDEIEPKYEIVFPVTNLNQIWIAGTIGDGVIISVRGR